MKVYLLRHGEPSWNQDQRLQWLHHIPLNGTNIRQSLRRAEWHRSTGVRRIVSSLLLRARRTAPILAQHSGQAFSTDNRLQEIGHGPWTGLRVAAVADPFPDELATWSLFSERLRLPNSESLVAAYQRCTGSLIDLVKENRDEDLLVVSHGVVNALLLCAAKGTSLSRIRECSPPKAAASALRVGRRKIAAVERNLDVIAQ